MSYKIGGECIACGRCAKNCPVECIHPAGDQYEIDQDQCVQCGTCYDNCPLSAIAKEE